jgi:hypothetical protein
MAITGATRPDDVLALVARPNVALMMPRFEYSSVWVPPAMILLSTKKRNHQLAAR